MQSRHGAFRSLLEQQRYGIRRGTHRLQHQIFLDAWRAREHVIDDFGLVAGMTDAQTNSPKIFADVRDGVAQSIVSAMSAALLQSHGAYGQIELVVRNQDLLRQDLEEIAHLPDRQAAAIHIGSRLQQRDFLIADVDSSRLAREFSIIAKFAVMTARKQLHEPETRVVASHLMFRAWIAQTND